MPPRKSWFHTIAEESSRPDNCAYVTHAPLSARDDDDLTRQRRACGVPHSPADSREGRTTDASGRRAASLNQGAEGGRIVSSVLSGTLFSSPSEIWFRCSPRSLPRSLLPRARFCRALSPWFEQKKKKKKKKKNSLKLLEYESIETSRGIESNEEGKNYHTLPTGASSRAIEILHHQRLQLR